MGAPVYFNALRSGGYVTTEDETYARCLEAMTAMGRASRWYQRRLARGLGMDIIPGYETHVVVNGRWELRKLADEPLTDMEPGEAEYNARLDMEP